MINYDIAAEILSNMSDEAHAQAGYCILIDAMIKAGCCENDINIIKEIQSDERNHTLKLFNLAQKYNGIKTTGDDHAKIMAELNAGFAV